MYKIILEDEILDLSGNDTISLNYTVCSVEDFTKRNGSYSKTITVPGTKNNNDIFKHYWEIGSADGYNPNKKVRASLEFESTKLFDGYIQLTKINRNLRDNSIEYEINFLSDLNKFTKDISGEGKYLSDISSLSALTHSWNWETVQSTWYKQEQDYYYPILDKHNYQLGTINQPSADRSIDLNDIKPAINLKYLLDGIFKDSSYSYDSDILNNERFTKLYLPLNKAERSDDFIKSQRFKAVQSNDDVITWTGWTPSTSFSPYQLDQFPLHLDDDSFLGYDNSNNWDNTNFNLTSRYTFRGSFRINLSMTTTANVNTTIAGAVELRINNQVIEYQNWHLGAAGGTFYPYTFDLTFDTQVMDIFAGDKVELWIDSKNYTPNISYQINREKTSLELISIDSSIILNDTFDFKQVLPKISQLDFFKNIMLMYNLMVDISKSNENTLFITDRETYYKSGKVVDWTRYLDVSKDIQIKPMSELSSRILNFTWQANEDILNKGYYDRWASVFGSNEIIIDNDFLSIDSTKTISPFFSIPLNSLIPNSRFMSLPKYYNIDGDSVDTVIDKNTIIYRNDVYDCETYYVNTGYTTTSFTYVPVNKYPYSSILLGNKDNPKFSLTWDTPRETYYEFSGGTAYPTANLYSEYYDSTVKEYTSNESKLLICYMNLKYSTIEQLDFRDQIFIDIDGGNYFKLISIEDFSYDNKLCKVTLLKSLELVKSVPPFRATKPNYVNADVFAVERIQQGRNNQVLGNYNNVNGGNNKILSQSYHNEIIGRDNIIGANSENNFIIGNSNSGNGLTALIFGGSGNSVSIANSTILNSNNVRIQNSDITGLTNNSITVINSSGITIGDKKNIVAIGLNKPAAFEYDNATYTNQLSIKGLTASTYDVLGIKNDGLLFRITGFTGTTIVTGDTFWKRSIGANSLVRSNGNHYSASENSIIAGGYGNYTSGDCSGVFAGTNHYNLGTSSAIIAGASNYIGGSNQNSFIGSGKYNRINTLGVSSIIGAGNYNIVDDNYSSIVSGQHNYIKRKTGYNLGLNHISSGKYNSIKYAIGSSILGGQFNQITSTSSSYNNFSSILGGDSNIIDTCNYSSIIGGGQNKIINSQNSAILTGVFNKIDSCQNSVILNGNFITASTSYTVYADNMNLKSLIGTGIRMVVSDSLGNLSTQTIPSITGSTGTITAATLNNLTVTGNTSLQSISATTYYSGSTLLSSLIPKQIFDLSSYRRKGTLFSERIYSPAIVGFASGSATYTNNTQYFIPFVISNTPCTIDLLQLQVMATGTTSLIRLGIYNCYEDYYLPKDLLGQTSELTAGTGSNILVSGSTNITINAQGIYFLSFNSSVTRSWRTIPLAGMPVILGMPNTASNVPCIGYTVTTTFGAMSSVTTATTFSQINTSVSTVPQIQFRLN